MMIIMTAQASAEEIASVVARVEAAGLNAHLVQGAERNVIGVVGDIRRINREQFKLLPGVDSLLPISRPYKLASREFIPQELGFPDRRGADGRA